MAALHDNGFEPIGHPTYSPDLAPSAFHLFPNMKKELAGKYYANDNNVISAVKKFLDLHEDTFFASRSRQCSIGNRSV